MAFCSFFRLPRFFLSAGSEDGEWLRGLDSDLLSGSFCFLFFWLTGVGGWDSRAAGFPFGAHVLGEGGGVAGSAEPAA